MELIKMYGPKLVCSAKYIEGVGKQCKYITLWDDEDGLEQTDYPFFTYASENRVGKETNPFIK